MSKQPSVVTAVGSECVCVCVCERERERERPWLEVRGAAVLQCPPAPVAILRCGSISGDR